MSDFKNNVLNNIPNWWKKDDASNNYKLINSIDKTNIVFETNLNNFFDSFRISTAVGNELDDIAKLFNLTRLLNEPDEVYRNRITNYLSIKSSQGSYTDLRDIISFYMGLNTEDITITQVRTLVISISIKIDNSTNLDVLKTLNKLIDDIKPAGVYVLDIDYQSRNNIFLTNLSYTNSEDKIL